MNYRETLNYIYSHLPMFTRIGPAALKPNLDNTLALCKMLDNPENKFRSVHIAGTNGKGSTSHMIASILQESGYKTGLYTSPHLKDFRERIRINGIMITEQQVMNFVNTHRESFELIQPSFFEWTVALCFDHFAAHRVDVAIVETGLGGRLDSTNVIKPLLSVITNIGLDHTDILGDTLEKIASEKAGIIKGNCPVVIGEKSEQTTAVFISKASEMSAPIIFAEEKCLINGLQLIEDGLLFTIQYGDWKLENVFCDLGGIYQEKNLKTAITALLQLRSAGFTVTDEHIRTGLSKVKANTRLMGRWQVLTDEPLMVCDTGHNPEGMAYVVKQIALQNKKVHFVIGMVKDKDVHKTLSLLPQDATYYFCRADLPRSLPADELKEKATEFNLKGKVYESVKDALAAAKKQAARNEMIFIGGSTFVVGEII